MKYETAWQWDGSWRDIYILDTTLSDWQRLGSWLRTGPYPIEFSLNNVATSLPTDVVSIFRKRNKANILLKVDVDGVIAQCHFFWPKEIEFDIDPREVNNE
jgi:hypothetical protein